MHLTVDIRLATRDYGISCQLNVASKSWKCILINKAVCSCKFSPANSLVFIICKILS